MKIKLRLILVFAIILSTKFFAANFKDLTIPAKNKGEIVFLKSTKNNTHTSKRLTVLAAVNPPVVVAGSSCGPGVITLSATGVSGDTIEWFSSQTSTEVLSNQNTYSPFVSVTTTYYVSARSGLGTSIRVPVVASVFNSPPAVTLSSVPANNTINPLCLGTSITFTATGGADLFEFSVNGIVVQPMSSVRTYTTSTLTSGQVVSVKSRYAVTLNGSLGENAWGTAPFEDNVLSASLSGNAVNGYINALKISPTEDKLVFGIAGKALNFRRIMVFLDTKPLGFNVSNYGDEAGSVPQVRAFNYFNNNPSTFDSYFTADYCLSIATDGGETNYYADLIELKTGNSIKTYLGSGYTGEINPLIMGVNKNNTGTADYNLGFEVMIPRSSIGLPNTKDSQGLDTPSPDIKFFAFTMQDNDVSNYNVTNSFLSPATRTSDYGSGAIDYNLEAPNPVVVAGAALTPCYSTDSMTMIFVENPTVATVGQNQRSCSLISSGLGGNTPSIGTGAWSKKSGPGTVTFDDSSKGNAIATVSDPGTYVFTWTISSGQCTASSADIQVVYNVTAPPTALTPQNFCKISNPKVSNLVAVGNNIEWFADPIGGTPLPPSTDLATDIYYADQTNATTLCTSITRLPVNVVVDNPAGPVVPGTQTFCNSAKVSNLTATGTAVKWYAALTGGSPLDPTTDLVDGGTYYATQTVTGTLSCESIPRIPSKVTINFTPAPTGNPQVICNSGTVANLTATGTGIKWYADATGGSPLLSTQVLVSGTTYYASQTIGTCESDERYPDVVAIIDPQVPEGVDQLNKCATKPLQTLIATATVSAGTIVWYDTSAGVNEVPSPTWSAVGSVTYYAANKIGSCFSVSRTPVTLQIINSPFLSLTTNICSVDLATYTSDFTVASGSVITWVPALGSPVGNSITGITAGVNIEITADMQNGCVEKINVTAPNCNCPIVSNPISDGDKPVCEGQTNPILSATVLAGETIDWYSEISGGVLLEEDSPTYQPTVTLPGVYSYYAEARNIATGCISSGRTKVSLNIVGQNPPAGPSAQPFCESQNATVGDLLPNGPGILWYADATGGTPLSTAELLVDGADYYASQTATTGLLCESFERLQVTVIINKPAAPTGPSPQVFCNEATVDDLQVTTGSNIKWYDSLGTLLAASTPLTDGIYSATQTIALCESVSKLNVTVVIEKPAAIVIPGSLPFCESENATVASLTAAVTSIIPPGAVVVWYSSATGTTPLPSSTLLIDALYYGSLKLVSGCESTPRAEVEVKINAPASPTGDDQQLFCFSQSAKISDLVVTETNPITWYDAPVAGNTLPVTTPLVDGTKYYAAQNVLGCESVDLLEITAGIVNPLTPTIAKPDPLFCESEKATLNSIVLGGIINNSNVVWYDSPSAGVVLDPNTLIALGRVYYAVQRTTTPLDGCESGRLKVSPVLDKPQPGVIDSIKQPSCNENSGSVKFSGLPTPGNWTITPSSGTAVSGSGATYEFKNLLPSTDYTFKVTNGNGCTSVNPTVVPIDAVPVAPETPLLFSFVQPNCDTRSGTIVIGQQAGMEYSLDGINYKPTNEFINLAPNNYMLYVRNVLDATCVGISPSPFTINAVPTAPAVPTTTSIVQPTCASPSGTVTIAAPQTGMEYSLDGILFQSSNVFSNLVPNDYLIYVRNVLDATCLAISPSAFKINAIPVAPTTPTALSVVQPTCATPSGTIVIDVQTGVEYSLDGTTYQLSNVFSNLAPNDYMLYVRNVLDATCEGISTSSSKINAVPTAPAVPIALSIIQPTCAIPSGTVTISPPQTGMVYSLDGIVFQPSDVFSNLAPNDYLIYVRNAVDATCLAVSVSPFKINAIPTAPAAPTALSVVQPTCATPSGTIVIDATTGVEYSLDATVYQPSNVFNGLEPNDYVLYVRNIGDATCNATSSASTTINAKPLTPATPTLSRVIQPTCSEPSGTIEFDIISGVEYSIGNGYQDSQVFVGLVPKNYTISVRFKSNITCETFGSNQATINAVPSDIQFESSWTCESNKYEVTASPLSNSYDPNAVEYIWKDQNGNTVGANSNVLNVNDVIDATAETEKFPLTYTLTVKSSATGCETTSNVVIESIYCDIQKGISPDGNGSNDFLDLRLLGVKKLEMFNRYGIQVYSQSDYTNQWSGQTNNGEALPSATYYYVIEFYNGQSKTGWIYLIR